MEHFAWACQIVFVTFVSNTPITESVTWLSSIDFSQQATTPLVFPPEFEERVRFIVQEQLNQYGACEAHCRTCNQSFAPHLLHKEPWEQFDEIEGLRVGASGVKFICPFGHTLIAICTALY
jgi:hypothetical protein